MANLLTELSNNPRCMENNRILHFPFLALPPGEEPAAFPIFSTRNLPIFKASWAVGRCARIGRPKVDTDRTSIRRPNLRGVLMLTFADDNSPFVC